MLSIKTNHQKSKANLNNNRLNSVYFIAGFKKLV